MKNSHRFFFYPKLYLADLLNTPKIPPSTQVFCGRKGCVFFVFLWVFSRKVFSVPKGVFHSLKPKLFVFKVVSARNLPEKPRDLSFPTGCCSCNENIPHHTPTSNSLQSMEPSYCNSNPDIQIPEHHFWHAEKCPEYSVLGLCFHVLSSAIRFPLGCWRD